MIYQNLVCMLRMLRTVLSPPNYGNLDTLPFNTLIILHNSNHFGLIQNTFSPWFTQMLRMLRMMLSPPNYVSLDTLLFNTLSFWLNSKRFSTLIYSNMMNMLIILGMMLSPPTWTINLPIILFSYYSSYLWTFCSLQ